MTTLSRFAKKRAVDKELSILLKTSGQSSRIIKDNATQQLANLVTRWENQNRRNSCNNCLLYLATN